MTVSDFELFTVLVKIGGGDKDFGLYGMKMYLKAVVTLMLIF
jgi:hypothetical protein